MRRLWTILAFVALSLPLCPARADAYIWAWLDDLSGPKFVGAVLEVQIVCSYREAAGDLDTIWRIKRGVEKERDEYVSAAASATGASATYFNNASNYIAVALKAIDEARARLESDPKADVAQGAFTAVLFRLYAAKHFAWARYLRDGGKAPFKTAPTDPPTERLLTSVGGSFSICPSRPLQRDKRYLKLDVGYAWDVKDDNPKNRMFTLGLSYHWVLTPYFTFGAGGGLARFSTRVDGDGRSFNKVYLQPTIFDFRPFALGKDANLGSPWGHVFYLRYTTIVFPGGFEAGSFGGNSPEFPTEFVSAVGFYFDFAPVIRKARKKW